MLVKPRAKAASLSSFAPKILLVRRENMEIGRLSWSNTIDEQEKAVSELANSRDIDLKELIMPF